jgi:putative ABC transport system ATP-binding protein
MTEQTELLVLEGVKRTFPLGHSVVPALRGINIKIASGEVVAICGPSGSGKSTALNIMGLIDQADEGTVIFDDQNVSGLGQDELADIRNHKIGFVFQAFHLVPVFSALENVMLPLVIQGISQGVAKARASEWLERVGILEFASQRPDRLSGGQRQRVAIARALVTAPMLVIADEPTANLDSVNAQLIIDLLWELSRATNVTCIIATHDDRLIRKAPRCAVLKDGVIQEDVRNVV